MILYAARRTTTTCFYCGGKLMSCIATGRQRCTNDCASGLGAPHPSRLRSTNGIVYIGRMTVRCDVVVGRFNVIEGRTCQPNN